MVEQGSPIMILTIIFGGSEGLHFSLPHKNPLAVELEVANALVGQILIDNGSCVDIITWDCLRRLKHPGREIVTLLQPIVGFGRQVINPIGVIQLPLWLRGKSMIGNLEVDFLAIDVPTTYNVILGQPTLHRVKAVIASYLLELQYEADDGSVGKLQGDQWTAWECYLVSIQPSVESSSEHRLAKQLPSDKKPRITLPLPVKTMTVCTLTLADLDIFALSHEEITGISPAVMEHWQNVDPAHRLVV
ncbi:hypothetical protein Cgig2_017503 [Carnegiea gigantea]|uniref:Peptidase A2 domain-containing protein n=1 Tax=Carnegiea gigantea TaxID=171969 RepID=A0A9Q1K380_9CARY|nr:hypothetical protein Cgig2_017503 [Carnegiea gigantea]